ncbi:MAG TPA: alpha-ketoacid dehydrogenase subunit beta [Nitrospiria bacterium]|nr:alpha-ketoacid dehydrogenase subunit beta [Nitrospiria bacterium]
MEKLNLVSAVNLALREEMERDSSVVVMGEDVGKDGGVFRATEGLLEKFGEKRVIDTPLSETAIIGTAIGMAAYGLVPVVEIQFLGFIYSAMEQIISHAARLRTRTRGRYHCPMVIRTPYGGGIHAPEHHSESMEACFVHIPGIKVVVPSTPSDARNLLKAAIRDPDPVLFLEPARIYRAVREEIREENLSLFEARVARSGKDVTLISWGAMIHVTLKAAEALSREGVEAEVIDLRVLYPMDIDRVIRSVEKTGRAVVVHEAPLTGGLGGEIAALIQEKALLYLEAPVKRVAGFNTPIPLPKLEMTYLPGPDSVIEAVKEVLSF